MGPEPCGFHSVQAHVDRRLPTLIATPAGLQSSRSELVAKQLA